MKKEFNDYKDVSFLPIDLPYEKINLNELEVFHDRNYLWPPDVIKESYGGGAVKDAPYVEEHPHEIWRIVCLLGQLDDHEFSDPKAVRRSWVNRLERKQPVKHGFAVAMGIIIESYFAFKKSLIIQETYLEIKKTIDSYFGKHMKFELDVDSVMLLMRADKKNSTAQINFSLPIKIGGVKFNQEINEDEVKKLLLDFLKND